MICHDSFCGYTFFLAILAKWDGDKSWNSVVLRICVSYLMVSYVGDLYGCAASCFVLLLVYSNYSHCSCYVTNSFWITFEFCIILHQFHFHSTPRNPFLSMSLIVYFVKSVCASMGPWYINCCLHLSWTGRHGSTDGHLKR